VNRNRHVYALFERHEDAVAAYREVQDRGCRGEQCSVLLHEGSLDVDDLPMGETAAREGAAKGAILAGASGAVLLALIALPGGLLGVGPLAAALLGGGTGALYGGLLGALSGASDPDKTLRRIEQDVRSGKVLVGVETDDPALASTCGDVFVSHHGRSVTSET
jgi:hypothetical protein